MKHLKDRALFVRDIQSEERHKVVAIGDVNECVQKLHEEIDCLEFKNSSEDKRSTWISWKEVKDLIDKWMGV